MVCLTPQREIEHRIGRTWITGAPELLPVTILEPYLDIHRWGRQPADRLGR